MASKSKARDQLRAVVQELITTERNYVKALKLLKEVFMPMYAELGAKRVSSKVDKVFQDMFASWKQLLAFHTLLLSRIERRCLIGGDSITDIGQLQLEDTAAIRLANVLIDHCDFFKMYSEYRMHFGAANPQIQKVREKDKEFDSLLKRFASHPRIQVDDISSILIKPIQRVPQYGLFMENMQKEAGKLDDDPGLQTDVTIALDKIKIAVEHVNQKPKDDENLAKIRKLQRKLRPENEVNLLKPHVRLVLEGNAMALQIPPATEFIRPYPKIPSGSDGQLHAPLSTSSAELVYIFLLTDLLIICRHKQKNKFIRRQDLYHIAKFIHLRSARVSMLDSVRDGMAEKGLGRHALKIECDMHNGRAAWFALSLGSLDGRNNWCEKIENCIFKSQQKHSNSENYTKGTENSFGTSGVNVGVDGQNIGDGAASPTSMSVVSPPVVIPPGVDEEWFLSILPHMREEILINRGYMQQQKH